MTETLTPYLSSFFILFREGFEGLLICILVFTYLDKMNARHQRPAVIWGLIAGVVASLLSALAVKKIAAITHAHQELFEGSVMLIASGMLAYVAYFSHSAKQHVEGKVDKAISTGNPFFLSLTVFFSIIREGFEVVLFYAALFTSAIYSTLPVIAGAITGTFALVFVYFGLNKITKIIPIGSFFRISSILLLLLSVYFGYEGAKEFYAGLRELKVI
ncbi:MAG: high-affinity Fe2+/Pb2+ permease [Alphaproteobacteria bacterium]|jgi:high-affinity iron transporter|nr:high-affinity Fe2+/Pb2+ permease [Alphaproteobacteria bacterium]